MVIITEFTLLYVIMYIADTFCINEFIAGVKNKAPDPNPAMTTPDASPRLSGNHSIKA